MSLIIAGPYTQLVAPFQRGFGTSYCQKQTGRWSPTSGWTFDQDFRGLDYISMQGLANEYSAAGIEYELTLQNGIATLRTRDTTGNVTIDVWEISLSQQTISLFKNPLYVAALTTNDLTVIGRAYLDGTDLSTAVGKLNGDNPGITYTAPNFATASAQTLRLWNKVKNGEDAVYFGDQYSLRHTTSASNRGYYNVADVDVNCIYTQGQLYSEITNSTYWFFPCPPEIIGALNTIFSRLGSPPYNFLQGALKGGSSRVTSANNRVNLVTEYKLFNWDTDDYYLAT